MLELLADLQNIPVRAWLVMLGCVALLGLYAYVGKERRDGRQQMA